MTKNPIKKWILLRGLSREARHWGDFPSLLEEKAKADVYSIEIPGAGKKNKETSPLSIDEYTHLLRKEFLTLQKKSNEPWGIIAMSLGGMITLNWLSHYPDDFSKAIIINTSSRSVCPPWKRMRLKALLGLAGTLFKPAYEKEKTILEVTTTKRPIDEKTIFKHVTYSKECPISIKNTIRQIFAASVFTLPQSISVPMKFIAGKKDKLAATECSEKIAKYYNSPLIEHPEAGHDLSLDDPKWLIEQIIK